MSRTLCVVQVAVSAMALAPAWAAPPTVGQPIPSIEIRDKGELHLDNGRITLRPWNTDALRGQWTLLQYLAARPDASRLNRPAIDAINETAKAGGLRPYRLVNVVNLSDVTLGATTFALSALEDSKRQYPNLSMIADMGHARAHWEFAPRGSAILLVDENLVVRYFVDGQVDDAGVGRMLDFLRHP